MQLPVASSCSYPSESVSIFILVLTYPATVRDSTMETEVDEIRKGQSINRDWVNAAIPGILRGGRKHQNNIAAISVRQATLRGSAQGVEGVPRGVAHVLGRSGAGFAPSHNEPHRGRWHYVEGGLLPQRASSPPALGPAGVRRRTFERRRAGRLGNALVLITSYLIRGHEGTMAKVRDTRLDHETLYSVVAIVGINDRPCSPLATNASGDTPAQRPRGSAASFHAAAQDGHSYDTAPPALGRRQQASLGK